MPFDLSGKTALLTGATSGLGRHFAHVLARSGCDLAIAGRRRERLAELGAEVQSLGRRWVPLEFDVTEAASLSRAVDQALAELGPIDVLVNNAGMNIQGAAVDIPVEAYDRVMATNLRGPFLLATEVARRMIARAAGGRIINIASIGALRVLPGLATYCMSKAGLVMMTQCLAREWARYGICVNAICPGYIETELNSAWFGTDLGRAQVQTFPRRQLMQPEDLDEVLLLLASDAAASITGAIFTVDEGQSL